MPDSAVTPPTEINWRARMVKGGVVLLVILGLAVFFFGWTGQGPARTTMDNLNRTGLSELDTVRNLTEHPDGDASSPMEAFQTVEPPDQR